MDKFILLGHIVSAHGINGAVKIRSYTENIESIFSYNLFFENKSKIVLKHLFTKHPNLICTINNINNVSEVEKLIGLKIFTNREELPKTSDDEFYITDLINLDVLDKNNNLVGKINTISNYGAGDLIEVKFIDGKSEFLQFTKKNFPNISKDYVVLDRNE